MSLPSTIDAKTLGSIAYQLAVARQRLETVAKDNAGLEARLLACHAWRMSPEQLVMHGNETRDAARLDALIERRMKSEPIAHILGEKHFWRDVFVVSADVLTPRADSETMIETLLRLRSNHHAALRILDLGTGSGCLILSALREYPNARGIAVDQSPSALSIAKRNAVSLRLQDRVELRCSDWCSNVGSNVDVVLANPPYIPTADIATLDADVREFEPHTALDGGDDGLNCYRSIVQQLPPHLNEGAHVLFEVGQGQAHEVASFATNAGFTLIDIIKDLAGIDRVVALAF